MRHKQLKNIASSNRSTLERKRESLQVLGYFLPSAQTPTSILTRAWPDSETCDQQLEVLCYHYTLDVNRYRPVTTHGRMIPLLSAIPTHHLLALKHIHFSRGSSMYAPIQGLFHREEG